MDDGNNNSNSDSNSDSSTGTSTGTKTSSFSSLSSSCIATETALRVTILCLAIKYKTGGSTVSTTTCSPTTTITTTGCSVTGTTTNFFSSSSSPAQRVSASDTCGDACPIGVAPLSGAIMAVIATTGTCSSISKATVSVLPTARYEALDNIAVANPNGSTVPPSKREFSSNPLDYNQTFVDTSSSFLKRPLQNVTTPYTSYVSGLSETITAAKGWVSQDGHTSGHWYPYPSFGRRPVGVNGIYGCTAVFIMSDKGVYLSHIWENPVFVTGVNWDLTDDDFFMTNSFYAIRDGTAHAQSITGLLGTDDAPGVLNAIYAPKVFVLTPRTSDFDRAHFKITTALRYQDRAQTLGNQIARILPGSGGTGFVLGYTRTDVQLSTAAAGVAGRAILEVNPLQKLIIPNMADKPVDHIGLQIGRWRFWVEDNCITYQDFWIPRTLPPVSAIQQRNLGNPSSGYTGNVTSSNSCSSTISSGASKALQARTVHPLDLLRPQPVQLSPRF